MLSIGLTVACRFLPVIRIVKQAPVYKSLEHVRFADVMRIDVEKVLITITNGNVVHDDLGVKQ